ncbi:ABC transporter substrate-binding protein [Ferrimonas sp.]|uniref:ABC transporter substrate-binding protein n=1 Tax=Ferrimonas sp. TaxID=2080861 RepID=UPI003A91B6A8
MTVQAGVQLDNCGETLKLAAPAQRVIAMNQHASEALLTLGLAPQMIGTAYQDDEIRPDLKANYDAIPRLSREYPSPEQVLLSGTDLVVGGFASAFRAMGIGSREIWHGRGIPTYLFESACRPEGVSIEALYLDMLNLGRLTGRESEAKAWVQGQRARLAALAESQGRRPRVLLWLREYQLPYVAGCCGVGNLIIEAAGGINVAAEIGRPWGHLSWEAVAAAQPDLILMVDSNWSPYEKKWQALATHPLLSRLTAVRQQQLATLAFSEVVGGVRLLDGIERLHHTIVEWRG